MNKYLSLSIAAIVLLSVSCKKSSTSRTTSCSSTLYGYTLPVGSAYYDTACSFGIINESTAAFSILGTFSSCTYSTQAAYNTSDNCYYTFKMTMGDATSSSSLYRISTSGAVTALTNSSGAAYSSLTYNSSTNHLYGISTTLSGSYLVQITIAGTTFSSTSPVSPVHPFALYGWATADPVTVDNTTGDMYYVTGDTLTYYIEKYHPGASASTVVASGTGAWDIYGMQFNKNDNMLYAVRQNHPSNTCDFIKINPSTGSISTLAPFSIGINSDFYSTVIDPCSNRYIISTPINMGIYTVSQLSMTGSVLQFDTTATFYQGLSVK